MRIAILLLLWMNTALAAPFAVQVGDMRLALDAPPGFADTQFTGSPRLVELAESLTPASNRILLFGLEDADLKRFMVGDPIERRRFVIAVTPRAMERELLSLGSFRAFADGALEQDASLPPAGASVTDWLDARPEGRANPLAAPRIEPELASVLLGARLPKLRPNEPPRYLVSSHALLLLRGKALDLSVFSRYESPADLEWVRTTAERWIEELRRLNSR